MFASVAHRYDLLNHLLSLSIDRYWRSFTRRKLLRQLPSQPLILDLCTGTGDVALAFTPLASVIGCDFCRPMLEIGQAKAGRRGMDSHVRFVEGDALELPFPAESFDAVTIAFGLRNLEDYRSGLQEMHRVLKPAGRLAILEFSVPKLPLVRPLYLFYFTRILPRIGAIVSGRDGPYSYLPDSVREFPSRSALNQVVEGEGFRNAIDYPLSLGIATLYLAVKPFRGSKES
jgi:demethylmenaquinone methyltransferase/2-methoxy-6-polyprenyl-1,4-benzoquinol methylase